MTTKQIRNALTDSIETLRADPAAMMAINGRKIDHAERRRYRRALATGRIGFGDFCFLASRRYPWIRDARMCGVVMRETVARELIAMGVVEVERGDHRRGEYTITRYVRIGASS